MTAGEVTMTTDKLEKTITVDMHPESEMWLGIVQGNIDNIGKNFNRARKQLDKEIGKLDYKDGVNKCNLLRAFVKEWHSILDADVEILVHWAVRNDGAEKPGDHEFVVALREFREKVRAIKNESGNNYF
jgi:hypothetical protein